MDWAVELGQVRKIGFKEIAFQSDGNTLHGSLVYPQEVKDPPGILLLQGSGKDYGCMLFLEWQRYLAEKGYSSFAFNVRGVGGSQGEFEDSSLNNRLTDSLKALDVFLNSSKVDKERIGLVGTSMGAHVSGRLVEKIPSIKAVMLFGAAAYSKKAEDKPFNEAFSSVIRQEGSWKDSPVFNALEKFKGSLLVVYGGEDKVIPEGVKEKFKEVIGSRSNGRDGCFLFPDLEHYWLRPKDSKEGKVNPKQRKEMYAVADHFLEENLR